MVARSGERKKKMKALKILALVALVSVGSVPAVASIPGTKDGHVEIVAPYGTDTYPMIGFAGELTRLVVRGGSHTDLDLFVYDENGNLIASDTDLTSTCIVTFVPRWTGRFTVKVVNRGQWSNAYEITLTSS
jgi:hypothetical protein